MTFLQSKKPLLYKSATEGNILIRLTNVNYSPNQQLSRLVFSFNGTGTEIGEATVENLNKYKILNKNGDDDTTVDVVGAHASHSPIV